VSESEKTAGFFFVDKIVIANRYNEDLRNLATELEQNCEGVNDAHFRVADRWDAANFSLGLPRFSWEATAARLRERASSSGR
jgi:hypothetical protein